LALAKRSRANSRSPRRNVRRTAPSNPLLTSLRTFDDATLSKLAGSADADGVAPLIAAALADSLVIVKLCVAAGAGTTDVMEGMSLQDIACSRNAYDLLDALRPNQ
jgi:hypothetical protein